MVVGVQADGAAQRRLLIVDRGSGVSGGCRRGIGSGREHGRGVWSRGRRGVGSRGRRGIGGRGRIGLLLILKLSPLCGNGDVAVSIFLRSTPASELIALAGGISRIQILVTVALIEGCGLDGCIIVSVFPSHGESIGIRSRVGYRNHHVLQLGRSFHNQFIGSVIIDYGRFLSLQALDSLHSEVQNTRISNLLTVLINIVDGPGILDRRILNSDNLITGRHFALYDIHFRAIAVKFRRRYIVFLSSLALLVN